jgi:hypothetical protein
MSEIPRPWLVVSGGRTGSSTVARLLHEEMNINMGPKFSPGDEFNPKGYYEDQEFYALDDALLDKGKMNPYHYSGILAGLIEQRGRRGIPWGVKNPWLRITIGHYIDLIREYFQVSPIIISPRRPLHWVAHSLMKMKPDWAENYKGVYMELAVRQAIFTEYMKAYPEITVHEFWFRSKNVPDELVLNWLKRIQEEENAKEN